MKGYTATEAAHPHDQALRDQVERLLGEIPETVGGWEIRCHELARAVARLYDLVVVDGHMGDAEHSWCLCPMRGTAAPWLLDVYVPGRLPMVQLVDPCSTTLHEGTRAGRRVRRGLYVAGGARTDIDAGMVDALHVWLRSRAAPHLGTCEILASDASAGQPGDEAALFDVGEDDSLCDDLHPVGLSESATPEEAEATSRLSVGRRLRWLRAKAGRTLGDLADFLGCSATEASALEMDRYPYDPFREAEERRVIEATDALLHPNGRCSCGGEGTCATWCQKPCLGCGQAFADHVEDPGLCRRDSAANVDPPTVETSR